MPTTPRILAFAGSTREGSYNKVLVKAAAGAARAAGADVTYLELKELNLPMFDEDLEKQVTLPEGLQLVPSAVRKNS